MLGVGVMVGVATTVAVTVVAVVVGVVAVAVALATWPNPLSVMARQRLAPLVRGAPLKVALGDTGRTLEPSDRLPGVVPDGATKVPTVPHSVSIVVALAVSVTEDRALLPVTIPERQIFWPVAMAEESEPLIVVFAGMVYVTLTVASVNCSVPAVVEVAAV